VKRKTEKMKRQRDSAHVAPSSIYRRSRGQTQRECAEIKTKRER